jgi:hypothetical protein
VILRIPLGNLEKVYQEKIGELLARKGIYGLWDSVNKAPVFHSETSGFRGWNNSLVLDGLSTFSWRCVLEVKSHLSETQLAGLLFFH